MRNETGTRTLVRPSPAELAARIIDGWETLYEAIGNISADLQSKKFSIESLREQLKAKKKIVEAIESFLMAYRGDVDSETFVANAKKLASETLAFSLADEEQQALLTGIFESVARHIELRVPRAEDQRRFGRTLLGVDHALAVEAWVIENERAIVASDST